MSEVPEEQEIHEDDLVEVDDDGNPIEGDDTTNSNPYEGAEDEANDTEVQ